MEPIAIGEAFEFSHVTRKHQNGQPRKWAKGPWLLDQLTPQAHFSPTRKPEDPEKEREIENFFGEESKSDEEGARSKYNTEELEDVKRRLKILEDLMSFYIKQEPLERVAILEEELKNLIQILSDYALVLPKNDFKAIFFSRLIAFKDLLSISASVLSIAKNFPLLYS